MENNVKSSKLKDMIEASDEKKREKDRQAQQQQRSCVGGGKIQKKNDQTLLFSSGNSSIKEKALSTFGLNADGEKETSWVKLGVSKSTSSAHFSPSFTSSSKTFSLTKNPTMDELVSNGKLITTFGKEEKTTCRKLFNANYDDYDSKEKIGLLKSRSTGALTTIQQEKLRIENMKAIVDKNQNIISQDGHDNDAKIMSQRNPSRPITSISRFGRFQSLKVEPSQSGGGIRERGIKNVHFLPWHADKQIPSSAFVRVIEHRNREINMQSEDAEYWKGLW
jgi:hypothetical protein